MSEQRAREAFFDALLDDDPGKLYDRAPCGFVSTTPDGTVVKVNRTFLTWTGYRREDLVGRRTFADLLTVGGRIYHETHYAPMLRLQDSVREVALDVVRADGTRVPVLVNSVMERDDRGTPVAVRIAVFDATERREYERELLRSKERAEQLEARASALARTLQQTLIPPSPPDVPGLDVAAAYRPAGSGEEVGGDFYDIFQIRDGEWVVAIGDVRGKGAEAAVVTALVRYTLRGVTVRLPRPREALHALNDVLLRDATDRFCTVALVRLRQDAGGAWTATLTCGGHPLPLLRRTGREPVLVGAAGSLLGVLDEPTFVDVEVPLQPGDALVLFTDGVTEGRRGREFYGDERVAACVDRARGTADDLTRELVEEVLAFQDGIPRDDIAVVALRVPDAPAAPPTPHRS